MATRAPNSEVTGFQSVPVRNLNPNLCKAGHATSHNDTRMARTDMNTRNAMNPVPARNNRSGSDFLADGGVNIDGRIASVIRNKATWSSRERAGWGSLSPHCPPFTTNGPPVAPGPYFSIVAG